MIMTGENLSTQYLSQCQFVHHESHMNWPEIETGHQQSQDRRLNARPKGLNGPIHCTLNCVKQLHEKLD